MAERFDHAADAERLMAAADQKTPQAAAVLVAAAQVRATLALVEQQRIANLISVYTATGEVESGFVGAGIDFGRIAAQIEEGLGL